MNTSTPPPLGSPAGTPSAHPGKPGVLALLKQPADTVRAIVAGGEVVRLTLLFLASAALSFAVFGLVLGSYSGGDQLWAVPLKVAGGGLFAALLCLPSFIIFCVMGGMEVCLSRILLVLSGFLALAGLMLIGFAPVAWLFSVSTDSIGFMGFLAMVIALLSFAVGGGALWKMAAALGLQKSRWLAIWQLIFLFVVLQLTCTLRPLIGPYDGFVHLGEKRFFLVHWVTGGEGIREGQSRR